MRTKRLEQLSRKQAQSLGFLLIRCGQLFDELGIARVNAAAGRVMLRPAHTRLIPHLQHDEGIGITELARRMGVTKQAVQPLVAELAETGVVKLTADPDDARAKRVTLTAFGVEAMLHGTGVLEQLEAELTPEVGAAHVKALKKSLTALLEVLERSEGQ